IPLSIKSDPLHIAWSLYSLFFTCCVSFHSLAFSKASFELTLISLRIFFPDFGVNKMADEAPITPPTNVPNNNSRFLIFLLYINVNTSFSDYVLIHSQSELMIKLFIPNH